MFISVLFAEGFQCFFFPTVAIMHTIFIIIVTSCLFNNEFIWASKLTNMHSPMDFIQFSRQYKKYVKMSKTHSEK